MTNLLEQLAKTTVPPPPKEEDFDIELHRRVNQSLLFGHAIDLVRAIFFSMVHLGQALFGLIGYTATGQYPSPHRRKWPREEE